MDVAETNGPELEAMSREKVLQKVASPHLKDLIEQAIGRTASGSARA
jgi:iron(III) transport system substrate-binding protein